MNKKLMCGLMMSVSLFSISAYAVDGNDALTTKKYVNDGLSFVYGVANGTENGAVKTLQATVGSATNGNTAGTGLIGRIEGLESAVGDDTTGLVKDVADLQETIGDTTSGLVKKVNDLAASSNVYEAGAGIKVTPGANEGDPSTISVKLPDGAQNGAKYVFQADSNGGTWTQMEVADTWNPGFLTNP